MRTKQQKDLPEIVEEEVDEEKSDFSFEDVALQKTLPGIRPKNETPEERKARKALVKAQKKVSAW